MAMSTETPVRYWTANTMYIRDITKKFIEKETIESDVFFCRQDPQPVNFRFGIHFGVTASRCSNPRFDYISVMIKATRNIPKAKMCVSFFDNEWNTINTFTVNPPSFSKKETLGYIYIGHLPSFALNWLHSNMRLICEVEYEASPNGPMAQWPNSLHSDLLKLLESSENADVTFLVKGEKIKAHKNILGARSDYFRRMFDSDMEESVSNEVDIQDSEPDVVTGMLQYLYSGFAPKNLAVIVMDLLAVSDKYGLDELKGICESNICSNLTAKTVVDALILADRHGCEDLMTRAKIILRTNIGAVKRSKQDWEKLRSHPDLLLKLLDIYGGIEDDI